MVRLKESLKREKNCEELISIPYGSIKSSYTKLFAAIRAISIPYGSIKRCSLIAVDFTLSIFQFLMVRLKENLKACTLNF